MPSIQSRFTQKRNEMSDFRQRLIDEYLDLQIKLEKLQAYILSTAFDALPDIDQKDLREQCRHMQAYHDVLSRRCSRLCT